MTQVGELLPSMIEQFKGGFDETIAKNKHRRERYFILFTADWYNHETQMKCVFSPRNTKPPVMLNTMCWEIDNKSGSVKELWVLPKDAPIDPAIPLGEPIEGLIKVAKHLPLFYN